MAGTTVSKFLASVWAQSGVGVRVCGACVSPCVWCASLCYTVFTLTLPGVMPAGLTPVGPLLELLLIKHDTHLPLKGHH